MYTKESIKTLLATNAAWTERAIIRLFELQTRDEQIERHTKHHNGVGFNGTDSRTLSYYAKWLSSGKHLSGKHLHKAQRMVPKYAGQVLEMINTNKAA